MTVTGLDDTTRQFKLIEEDSGIGWAVSFILLAIAIGFALIMFLDRQPKVEYTIEKSFLEFREGCPLLRNYSSEVARRRTISDAGMIDLDEPVDWNSGNACPVQAASSKRYSHVQ